MLINNIGWRAKKKKKKIQFLIIRTDRRYELNIQKLQ